MSSTFSDPRYRPAILALAGISAVYAIYFIQQRYVISPQASQPQAQLRRQNAIHRRDAPRRRGELSPQREGDSIAISDHAVAALQTREEEGRSYGYLNIESLEPESGRDTGRNRGTRWPLLPAMLPTAEHFHRQEGISAEDARRLRLHAELMFMHAFLITEYPPDHTIGPFEGNFLRGRLSSMGIGSSVIQQSIESFNMIPGYASEMGQQSQDGVQYTLSADSMAQLHRLDELFRALDENATDEHSNFDWRDENADGSADREGQNTLNLLYNIAADQARKDGYIHRGLECDGCGIMPIQGVRYRCANCLDFDLCESCEAQELHIKTHVFYKIRVPAPSMGALGNSRQSMPVWYPGKPAAMPSSLPQQLSNRLLHETGFDNSELDALWDQFRCLAGTEWAKDPCKLGMAIDRKTFDKCFVPPLTIRPPPPNLIYDRMFAFYDTDNDGLIGFEEFLRGLASLNDKSRGGRLRRIFQGYDMDNDGYVDRRDFLRMFRAFYTLSKELNREMVAGLEEGLLEGGAREVVHGSQPISSAFPGSIPTGLASRGGVGKELNANGDLAIVDDGGVLDDHPNDTADRNQVIADIAMRYRRLPSQLRQVEGDAPNTHPADRDNSSTENAGMTVDGGPPLHERRWPPFGGVRATDIVNALGGEVPLSEIMDPVDRARILFAQSERIDAEFEAETERRRNDAVQERWRRRRFYTDVEEGATAPAGYTEADSSDDGVENREEGMDSATFASASRPLSPRSRSSSKVRFEDSVTDTDYETRSNTSSRSIPVGERWGGYDISEIEKDAGKEILYQAVQQGFNELLDQLFKDKEDLAMEAHKTRKIRRHYAKEIRAFADSLKPKPESFADRPDQKNETAVTAEDGANLQRQDAELDSLVEEAGSPFDEAATDAEQAPSRTNPPPLPPDHPIFTGQTYGFSLHDYVPAAPTLSRAHHPALDPTMPQFRPNEPGTNPDLSATKLIPPPDPNTSRPKHLPPGPRNAHPDLADPSSPAARQIWSMYLRHEEVDEEARARGGFGRLDYSEFIRGMIGGDGAGVDDSRAWKGVGRDGMGKLGFVGSWIEVASF